MSGNVCIVVLFDDTTPQVSVFGDMSGDTGGSADASEYPRERLE
jgi:hypothetical protein